MTNWVETKLGNLIDIKHGFAFKGKFFQEESNGIILITPGNFNIGGGFKTDKFKYYNGEIPEDYVFRGGELIVTMTDLSKGVDTLGYSAIVPIDSDNTYLHNQRIGLVIPKSHEVYLPFINWLMRAPDYRWHVVSSASGSTVSHTSPTRIKEFIFDLPPQNEQKAISAVLSSLDDKIDLLHRQNKTLENIAQTLFRHWFVETAEDWEEGVIPDEFDFTMGLSPPGSSYNQEGEGTPMFQGNADFGFRFPENRVYTTDPRRYAEKYDTLISVRAPVGAQNMAYEKCCIGRGVAAFRYKRNPSYYTYAYFKLRSLMDEIRQFNNEGTVFGSISKRDFVAFEINIPSDDAVDMFQTEVKPIDDKVIANCQQIRTLEKLRDTLLPKLMSGEVRVRQN